MTFAALLLAADQPEEELNFYTVSPGLPGFITFFVLAVAGWLLFRSMTRHMRKVQRRAAQERAAQEGAAEERAAEQAGRTGPRVPTSPTDPASPDEADRRAERP